MRKLLCMEADQHPIPRNAHHHRDVPHHRFVHSAQIGASAKPALLHCSAKPCGSYSVWKQTSIRFPGTLTTIVMFLITASFTPLRSEPPPTPHYFIVVPSHAEVTLYGSRPASDSPERSPPS